MKNLKYHFRSILSNFTDYFRGNILKKICSTVFPQARLANRYRNVVDSKFKLLEVFDQASFHM